MMLQQSPTDNALWHWLPTREAPMRELYVALDGLPAVLGWLAEDRFNGAMLVDAGPHELVLLLLDGTPVGGGLRSQDGLPPLEGQAALRGWTERAAGSTSMVTRLLTLSRQVVECLTAGLDVTATSRFIGDTTELRDTLRELAQRGHSGLIDVTAGDQWSRALLYRGRLLGAYDNHAPVLAASLASLGRLATRDHAMVTVRTMPTGPLSRLDWSAPTGSAATASAAPPAAPNIERDEQVETDFLWLLSQVDRDYERALRSGEPEARGLQVLASFSNALFSFATHLVPAKATHEPPPRLPAVLDSLRPRYPLVDELTLRREEIDAPAVARRYKALPRGSGVAADFQWGVGHVMLVLVQHSMGVVIREVGDAAVRQRCMMALETWMGSIEGTLRRAPAAADGR